jgi:hypothetical protein
VTELNWPTPEDVVAALDASGHLMEQQVASELERLGYNVSTNRAFTDSEEGKSRELDVFAHRTFLLDEERRMSVGVNLLIECKATSAPFAFLTRSLPPLVRQGEEFIFTYHTPGADRSESKVASGGSEPAFAALGLEKHYWATRDPTRAVHVSRLDRQSGSWSAKNTGIFDSITYPMAKALRAFKAPFLNPNHGYDPVHDWCWTTLFLPVAVIGSKLFAVDGTVDDPSAVEVEHIRLRRELRASDLKGMFEFEFVQRDRLGHFVNSLVTPFGEKLAEIAQDTPNLVVPPKGWPMFGPR